MSARILIVGTYYSSSGYGRAAAENILALDAAGADVACRPFYFGPAQRTTHPRLLDLEQKRFDAIDVLVQHVPAYSMSYLGDGGVNVGSFYFETVPLQAQWTRRSCLLDAVLFPARDMVRSFEDSPGYDPAVRVVTCPLPADPARYSRSYPRVPRFDSFGADGRFLFYTVGELNKRKNLSGLLRAYFGEFRAHEPVGLVVKATLQGATQSDTEAHVTAIVQDVARGCKLTETPPVYVVGERLSEEGLAALHLACDVFVQPSCGEAWSYPAFDAMAFGRPPIVTATGGYLEYLDHTSGWLVPGRMEPVFAETDVHAELFTGRQAWCVPDLLRFQACMREAYEDRRGLEDKAARGLDRAGQFSHEAIGPRLLKVLTDVQAQVRAPG